MSLAEGMHTKQTPEECRDHPTVTILDVHTVAPANITSEHTELDSSLARTVQRAGAMHVDFTLPIEGTEEAGHLPLKKSCVCRIVAVATHAVFMTAFRVHVPAACIFCLFRRVDTASM